MPKFVIERLARCFRSSPSSSRRSRPVVAALDPPIGPGTQKTRPCVIELHRHDRRAALQRRGRQSRPLRARRAAWPISDAFWIRLKEVVPSGPTQHSSPNPRPMPFIAPIIPAINRSTSIADHRRHIRALHGKPGCLEKRCPSYGDRWFESFSLHQRVRCEPDFADHFDRHSQ